MAINELSEEQERLDILQAAYEKTSAQIEDAATPHSEKVALRSGNKHLRGRIVKQILKVTDLRRRAGV